MGHGGASGVGGPIGGRSGIGHHEVLLAVLAYHEVVLGKADLFVLLDDGRVFLGALAFHGPGLGEKAKEPGCVENTLRVGVGRVHIGDDSLRHARLIGVGGLHDGQHAELLARHAGKQLVDALGGRKCHRLGHDGLVSVGNGRQVVGDVLLLGAGGLDFDFR